MKRSILMMIIVLAGCRELYSLPERIPLPAGSSGMSYSSYSGMSYSSYSAGFNLPAGTKVVSLPYYPPTSPSTVKIVPNGGGRVVASSGGVNYFDSIGTLGGFPFLGGVYSSYFSVYIRAVPAPGYRFGQFMFWFPWPYDFPQISRANPSLMFSGSFRPLSCTAYFVPLNELYKVVVVAANGSVSGAGNFNLGAGVTLTATPQPNYRFTGWKVLVNHSGGVVNINNSNLSEYGSNTNNPYMFSVEGDTYVTANFETVFSATMVAPTNGAVFLRGQPIQIQAMVSNAFGSVSNVEFYADGSKIGEACKSPYSTTWSNEATGVVSLKSIARGTLGEVVESPAITVSIVPFIDADADGLPDLWEMHYFSNLNQNASGDYDCDGLSNLEEYELGTDPTDSHSNNSLYVDAANGSDTNSGNYAAPFKTINNGIIVASNGVKVVVMPGIYQGPGNVDLDFKGKPLWLTAATGPTNTVIDCGGSARGFYFHSAESSNSIVEGFTIQNGSSSNGGGGIRCEYSSPTIKRCLIRNGSAVQGGGVYLGTSANLSLVNCVIVGNKASQYGAGLFSLNGSILKMQNCTVANNHSAGDGGGAMIEPTACLKMRNCIVANNAPDQLMGATEVLGDEMAPIWWISQWSIQSPMVWGLEGPILTANGDGEVRTIRNDIIPHTNATYHCTAWVTAPWAYFENGIHCGVGFIFGYPGEWANLNITNSTRGRADCYVNVWDGKLVNGGVRILGFAHGDITEIEWLSIRKVIIAANANNEITYSFVQNGFPGLGIQGSFLNGGGGFGVGNLTAADPFLWSGNGYNLTSNSPCIMAGSPDSAPANDLDGGARRAAASGVDMGAVEFHGDSGWNVPPQVYISDPAGRNVFVQGLPITITAAASDSDGTVSRVEFYVDGSKVGEASGSSYHWVWIGAPVGWHQLTAVATDSGGLRSLMSPPVRVKVVAQRSGFDPRLPIHVTVENMGPQ